jgi:hypothetical protein
MASHDYAPGGHQHANVERRTHEALEENVGRNLEGDVWDEEERQQEIPLNARDAKVSLDAFDLGVANVGAIQMRDKVKNSQHGNQTAIDLQLVSGLAGSRHDNHCTLCISFFLIAGVQLL